MVDEQMDPRTVEAMKTFRMETDNANEIFRKLERNMGKFTRKMNMVNIKTAGFAKNWKDLSRVKGLEEASKSLDNFQKRMTNVQSMQVDAGGRESPRTESPQTTNQHVEIGTIRIDVGGVTDKTDKQKLADEIGEKVAKSLQTKIGGPLSTGGYNRGM